MTTHNKGEMAVEEMLQYAPPSPALLGKLGSGVRTTVAQLSDIAETSRQQYYFSLIKEIISEEYSIGSLLELHQIFGGYVNTTFGVYVEKEGRKETWIVRQYRKGKTLDALTFEHRLLRHAKSNGNEFVAAPINTKDGKTYVIRDIDNGVEQEQHFFAIFNYIGGKQIYDWMPNWAVDTLKDITIETAAKSLAQFHSSTFDFDPQGLRGDNILATNEDMKVNELIADLPRRLLEFRLLYAQNGLNNKFTEYMDIFQSNYTEWCAKAAIAAADYQKLLQCPCHLDFHAGNFKYWDDESISGSFDYDMAMIDSRLFDIALGMHYTLASWSLKSSGAIDLARVEQFVRAYNENCEAIGKIQALSDIEKSYFFEAMLQAPIYVYGWAQGSVSADLSVNQYEYLFYCQHFSDSCQWLLEHEQEIRSLAGRL